MTRREMFRQCREGALQNLPRLLGTAGGLWGVLGTLVEQQRAAGVPEPAACFPAARADAGDNPTSDDTGE